MLTNDNLLVERPRLLIVDDSRMVRASLKKHLADTYDLLEEADGEAGWARLTLDNMIQLVISDVSMPKLDGHALLQRIRSSEDQRIRRVPVIIISGDDDDDAKSHAVSLGASDFITKSTDQVELLARIQSNLARSTAEKELVEAQKTIAEDATTDAVTGLFTRNSLIKQGDKLLAYTRRHDQAMSVLSLTIDRFDELLNRYPEAVCNKILQLVGKMLTGKLRGEDVVARCEDQHFVIVLPVASLNQALIAADRICQSTSAAKITFKGDTIKLSCSIGVASRDQIEKEHDFLSLLSLAVARRKHAQDQGGNWIEANLAVEVASTEPAPLLPMSAENTVSPDAGQIESDNIKIQQAIDWLTAGRHEEVIAHMPALFHELLPLLELMNAYYGLGLPLDAARQKMQNNS
ncbi:diguanylate cyclase [Leeia oryzae]|uniref:diguanylate cyclase n=1 Tax=Leeia oryzae TaxID=356662 RepID=UPI00036A23AE|nr:diguanylate cyclase [Leeia oryzae]